MLPEQLSISGECREDSLRALHVDVPGLRIHRRAGGRISLVDDVAQEIAEELPPKWLAGFGVKAGDALLQFGAIPQKTHDVNLAVGNDRSRSTRDVLYPKGLFGVDLVGQVFLE